MCKQFQKVTQEYSARVQAFVLMDNHIHLLIRTPLFNIDAIMNYWMRECSKKIGKYTNRINHIFGGPYKWCVIEDPLYLAHAYRYIYQNPVKAGLSNRVEEYLFSTGQFLFNTKITTPFRIFDLEGHRCQYIPDSANLRIAWLNQIYHDDQREVLRKALRKRVFKLSQCHKLRNTVSALHNI